MKEYRNLGDLGLKSKFNPKKADSMLFSERKILEAISQKT